MPADAVRGRRRRPRRSWVALAVIAAVVVAVAVLAARDLRRAHGSLREAEAAAGRAQGALLQGDLAAADEALAETERSFTSALAELGTPTLRAIGVVPVVRSNLDAVEGVSESGRLVASAGRAVTSAILDLPGGAAALAPREGRLPVEDIAALTPALEAAAEKVEAADQRLAATPGRLLVAPVAAARRTFAEQLAAVREPVQAGAALARILPGYLGQEGPRRYLFGAQNPAEARGTGGLIGAWTVLTVDRGTLRFGDFETITTLNVTADVATALTAPSDDYADRYTKFGAVGHGSNINMTPDFPTAMRALLTLYEVHHPTPLDGAIVADPFAFEALLRLSGPVEIPDVRELAAGNVVDFLSNTQWASFPDDGSRKPVLGDVAQATLQRFLRGGSGSPAHTLQVLARAAGAGHLLLHSVHPPEQDAFVTAGVAGAFPRGADDTVLGVILNNAAANKVDYYIEQDVHHEVWLDRSGDAFIRSTVRLTNTAPLDGRPGVVLGPQVDGLEAGDHLLYTSAYCGPGCVLVEHRSDGTPSSLASEREFGLQVGASTVRVPAGQTTELVYDWIQTAAWDGRDAAFEIAGQVAIRPRTTRLRVHPPLDMELVAVGGGGVEQGDGSLVWHGSGALRAALAVHARERGPLSSFAAP